MLLTTIFHLLVDQYIKNLAKEFDLDEEMAADLYLLKDFKIIILCDDSGSMNTNVDNSTYIPGGMNYVL